MGIKRYKPTSPGRREANVSDFADLTNSRPEKRLSAGAPKRWGRNHEGRVTASERRGAPQRPARVLVFPARDATFALVRMPSGEVPKIDVECLATIGTVGNAEHENISIGKAGRTRWRGIRPSVRGVAMNPVDHPMGGGEGKTSGGRHPTTPWGWKTKGMKTRNNKRTDGFIVRRRKSKG